MEATRTSPSSTGRPNTPNESVGSGMRRLILAGLAYGEARFKLAREEGRDLFGVGIKLLAAFLFVLFFFAVGYLLAIVALVDWAALHWWQGDLAPAAALVAGAHLVLAGVMVLWAGRLTRGRTFFHATRREYELDKQWLRTTTPFRKSSD